MAYLRFLRRNYAASKSFMHWFRVISVAEIKNNKIYHHDLGHFSGVQSKMNNELIII